MSSVTVLGLGRMGSAIAQRLISAGWSVRAWNRSPGALTSAGLTGIDGTEGRGPSEAVAGAELVLLCLFDGPACREVLAWCADALMPGALVVNTATVSPDQAEDLQHQCRSLGVRYLHAPVLGSVPAARTGSLMVLAGGHADDIDTARPLFEALAREIRHVGDARAAAAAKLTANTALAAALLGLRDALTVAERFGLDRDAALDLLAAGPLGTVVTAKRDRLATAAQDPDRNRMADFTAAALRKDVLLAVAAGGLPLHTCAELDRLVGTGEVSPSTDIAALALPATEPADPGVTAPLQEYVRLHATGDASRLDQAFLPTAHVEGIRDGEFTSWPLADYGALFTGSPAPTEPEHRRTVDWVVPAGTIAAAAMTLHHGPVTFTDLFLLVRTDQGWRIANKVYHRH